MKIDTVSQSELIRSAGVISERSGDQASLVIVLVAVQQFNRGRVSRLGSSMSMWCAEHVMTMLHAQAKFLVQSYRCAL